MTAHRLALFRPDSLPEIDYPPLVRGRDGQVYYQPPTHRLDVETGEIEPMPPGQKTLRAQTQFRRTMTLRAAYVAYHKPFLRAAGRAKTTLDDIEIALRKWERMTDNVPVASIDDDQLAIFSAELVASGVSSRTVNKNLGHVRSVLKTCGARSASNPRGRQSGRELIAEQPFVPGVPPQPKSRYRRNIPKDRLAVIDSASSSATWPRTAEYQYRCGSLGTGPGSPTDLAWQLAFALLSCVGGRHRELLNIAADDLIAGPTHPHYEQGVEIEWSHGWLRLEQPKVQRYKPEPLIVPCPPAVRRRADALNAVWPIATRSCRADGRPRLLPFTNNHRDVYDQLDAMQRKAAGGEEWAKTPYRPQDFRFTLNNLLRRAVGQDAARFALGHTPRDVNARWYSDYTEDLCHAWSERLVDLPESLAT